MNSIAPPIQIATATDSPRVDVYTELAHMETEGLDHFDPVRFEFMMSLANRAKTKPVAVEATLVEKLVQAIQQYKTDFEQDKAETAELASGLTEKAPAYMSAVKAAFKAHRFRYVKKCHAQLNVQLPQTRSLRELVDILLCNDEAQKQDTSFDDFLKSQEDDILQSYFSSAQPTEFTDREEQTGLPPTAAAFQATPLAPNYQDRTMGELRSAKLFRDSWVKQNAEKVIERVIAEGPENPGPLNPEGQVIKSILAMREISPEYLNRFISYLDTLLWLEQALTEDAAPTKSKKPKKKS